MDRGVWSVILEIENYSVHYGTFRALDDVSLKIPVTSIGLLGPNGAGKSTLIKAVLGLIKPTAGRGRFMHFDLNTQDKRIRRFVGYMPESDCLIPGFNAIQYVSYCGQLSGLSRRDAFKRAHRVLYLVGLQEARYRKLETYSTGMKQRLKLAQAIVHDPYLLFLDEPTNGLDPDGREEMLELIQEISAIENRCVVLSSHLMRDVERCTEYLVILNQGKVETQGYIADLCQGEVDHYLLRVNPDRDLAVRVLQEKGIKVQHIHPRDPSFEVALESATKPRDLFQMLIAEGIQIRQLVPRNYTVEEIYRKYVDLDKELAHAAQ